MPSKFEYRSSTKNMYFLTAPVSATKFQPGIDGKSYPEDDFVKQYEFALYSSPIRNLLTMYPEIAKQVIPYNHFVVSSRRISSMDTFRDSHPLVCKTVGKISFIQEPGFKLRAVANPSRILQRMLEPLKGALEQKLRRLSNDCTFDQAKGVKRVQQWLQEGRVCHSIDLSDATNMFPRHFQIDLVSQTFADPTGLLAQCLSIFEFACEAPWFSKENGVVTLHRFTRGQPLGLGPSFFMFAYTHNVLLRGLCIKHGLNGNDFVVLGDDVCIGNPELARLYRATLTNLGCKVSESKTITSDKFAEFAGKVILPNRVIHQNKWRDVDNSNFVDVCRQLGPPSRVLLSQRQKAVIDAIAEVPVEVGGLGWNPSGKSLSERLSTPIAQQLMDSSERYMTFESAGTRNGRFWNEMNLRGPKSIHDQLDNAALKELGFEGSADQAESSMTACENSHWVVSVGIHQMNMILGRPHPSVIRDTRDSVPGYVPVSAQTDDPFQKVSNDILYQLEQKVRRSKLVQLII